MLNPMSEQDRIELNLTYGDLATSQGNDYSLSDLRHYAAMAHQTADSLRTLTHDLDAGIKLQSLRHWTLRLHAATASLCAQRTARLSA